MIPVEAMVGDELAGDAPSLLSKHPDCELLCGLRDRVHLQGHCGLREQAAVDRGAGVHGDQRLGQDYSLEVSGGPNGDGASNLPEDVLGLRAAGQRHPGGAGLLECSRDLEDPDIVRAAREGNVGRDLQAGAPLVKPWDEREPADFASAQLDEARRDTPLGIDIGGLHVADRGSQGGGVIERARERTRGIDHVDLSGHFTAGEAKGSAGDGAGADVPGDGRGIDIRDPALAQDREVASGAKLDSGDDGRHLGGMGTTELPLRQIVSRRRAALALLASRVGPARNQGDKDKCGSGRGKAQFLRQRHGCSCWWLLAGWSS